MERLAAVDPITLILGALIAGASSGLKQTATKVITDGYAGLKRLIGDRYDIATRALEKKPDSDSQRAALQEELTDSGAGADAEVLAAARELLEAIETHDPEAATSVGVDLSKIDAGEINISGIKASGGSTAVRASDVNVRGSMNITDVEARGQDHP